MSYFLSELLPLTRTSTVLYFDSPSSGSKLHTAKGNRETGRKSSPIFPAFWEYEVPGYMDFRILNPQGLTRLMYTTWSSSLLLY